MDIDLKNSEFLGVVDYDVEQKHRFLTYLNYLRGLSGLIGPLLSDVSQTVSEIVSEEAFRRIQGRADADRQRIGQLLRNAWLTEMQLYSHAESDHHLVLALHWVPIQAYYCAYLALCAYSMARGSRAHTNHTELLKSTSSDIDQRPSLYPYPWCVLLHGDPESEKLELRNLRQGASAAGLSSLRNPRADECGGSFAMFLKTTRRGQLDRKCEDWKRKNARKRIPSKEKRLFLDRMAPTSLFDCLLRLRLRSNYSDIDSFLLAGVTDEQASEYHEHLLTISSGTLLILEVLTARYVGKADFANMIRVLTTGHSGRLESAPVSKRWESIKSAF